MRRATVAAVLAVFLSASPAFGQSGPMPADWYDNTDPHDLIGYHQYMTGRTNGFDVWDVWVCDPIGSSDYSSLNRFSTYTPRMVVDWLRKRSQIEQYFAWLSDGEYKLRFRVGGVVTPDMSERSFAEYANFHDRREACRTQIMTVSGSGHDGLMIVDTTDSFYSTVGSGWSGDAYCNDNCVPYPESGRNIYVDGSVWIDSYIHEIGHAIDWPHSFFYKENQRHPNEYTNPMDVMSGSIGWVGTTAINRYAAGWIDPDDVKVWKLGDKSRKYRLDPVGVTGGYQMLVLRDNHSSSYITYGARVISRFEEHLPQEGVEEYFVDESSDGALCDWDSWDWCPGTGRAVLAFGDPKSTDHVYAVGESTVVVLWDGEGWVDVDVTVRERDGDSFIVRVSYE